jgi:tRNA A37 threonylcarbamoyladenosine synthetase subunit TsaC/SUA5/YrdC
LPFSSIISDTFANTLSQFPAVLIRIYPDNPSRKELERCLHFLLDGEIIAYPFNTESRLTLPTYGLGCDALNPRAVEKLCHLKGFSSTKCMDMPQAGAVLCKDLSQIGSYTKMDNETFARIRKLLPGLPEFSIPAGKVLSKAYGNTVRIGIPPHPVTLEIIHLLDRPLLYLSPLDDGDEAEYGTDPSLIHEKWSPSLSAVIL